MCGVGVEVRVSFFPFFFCFNFCRYSPVLLCPIFDICPSYTVEISKKKKKKEPTEATKAQRGRLKGHFFSKSDFSTKTATSATLLSTSITIAFYFYLPRYSNKSKLTKEM